MLLSLLIIGASELVVSRPTVSTTCVGDVVDIAELPQFLYSAAEAVAYVKDKTFTNPSNTTLWSDVERKTGGLNSILPQVPPELRPYYLCMLDHLFNIRKDGARDLSPQERKRSENLFGKDVFTKEYNPGDLFNLHINLYLTRISFKRFGID